MAIESMHKTWCAFLEYVSGQTDRHIYAARNTSHRYVGRSNKFILYV